MNVQPYVFFDGKCEEALEFYKGAIGAKVDMVMHFKEAPAEMQAQMSPGSKDKVMHAAFRVGDTQILASDGECHGKPKFDGFSLTINAASDAEADKLFNALGKGGKVIAKWGDYREVTAPERLVFTYNTEYADGTVDPETLVTVTFENLAGRTRLTLRHEALWSEAASISHTGGWTGALERLAQFSAGDS